MSTISYPEARRYHPYNQNYLPKSIPQSYFPRIAVPKFQEPKQNVPVFGFQKKDELIQFPMLGRSSSVSTLHQSPHHQGNQFSSQRYDSPKITIMRSQFGSQIGTPSNFNVPPLNVQFSNIFCQTEKNAGNSSLPVTPRLFQSVCRDPIKAQVETLPFQARRSHLRRTTQPPRNQGPPSEFSGSAGVSRNVSEMESPSLSASKSELQTMTPQRLGESFEEDDSTKEASPLPKSILKRDNSKQSSEGGQESLNLSGDLIKSTLSTHSRKKSKRVTFSNELQSDS